MSKINFYYDIRLVLYSYSGVILKVVCRFVLICKLFVIVWFMINIEIKSRYLGI